MINEGCLEGIQEIYGLHNAPAGPEGTVSVKPNELLAGISDVEIKVNSENGDALTAACSIHTALHTIKSTKIDHHEKLVFTICEFLAGQGFLDLPKEALMRGSIRYFENHVYDKVIDEIDKISNHTAMIHNCHCHVKFTKDYVPLINSPLQTS